MQHFLQDEPIPADTNQRRRRGNAGGFQALAQQLAQGFRIGGSRVLFFLPNGGALHVNAAPPHRRGDDVQLLVIPFKRQETGQICSPRFLSHWSLVISH